MLVGADRDLGGLDVERQIPAVLVPGFQPLQVPGELFPVVLVVAGDPGEPAGGAQLELVEQLVFLEVAVADDVDQLDLGHIAFADLDMDGHPVAGQLLHLGVHLGAVATLGHILALQLLNHALENRLAKDLTFGETVVPQRLLELLGLDRLVALESDFRNGGTLLDVDDQNLVLAGDLDIVEIAGAEQGPGQILHALIVDQVAGAVGHGGEHRAGTDPLEALQADVVDDEHIGGGTAGDQPQQQGQQVALHNRTSSVVVVHPASK